MKAAFALFVLLFLSGAATAGRRAVLYVDGSTVWCSNGSSGTRSRPFCTIGAAAKRLPAGGTVVVASGVYSERVVVPFSGTRAHPLVFVAARRARVVLTGQTNGFVIADRRWIRVTGFTITHTREYGIAVSDSSHVTLSGNHVSYAGRPVAGGAKYGIRLKNVSDSLVAGNTVDHNTNSGIALVDRSTRDEVRGNRSFGNAKQFERAATGIRLYEAHGNTLDRNISHDNEDSGIELDKSPGNLVDNNVSYRNGDHGIDNTHASAGTRIVANSVYDNITAGINVEGESTGVTVANNISADNGIGSPRTHSDIRVDSNSVPGTSIDYDVVSLIAPDTVLVWDSIGYRTLRAFQLATGQELHAIDAEPHWRDPVHGDFHLTAQSRAIDSANSFVRGQPATDLNRNDRVDDLSTPNTGVGPRSYDDRGAYEYRAIDAKT